MILVNASTKGVFWNMKTKNTHSGLGHYVTGRIPWLLSYLTEIGISRNAFFTHQMKMLFLDKKKSLERKCRKVCSIFFNQISVNVTYTQRRFAVLINNASSEPPQKHWAANYTSIWYQTMKPKWKHPRRQATAANNDTLGKNLRKSESERIF